MGLYGFVWVCMGLYGFVCCASRVSKDIAAVVVVVVVSENPRKPKKKPKAENKKEQQKKEHKTLCVFFRLFPRQTVDDTAVSHQILAQVAAVVGLRL